MKRVTSLSRRAPPGAAANPHLLPHGFTELRKLLDDQVHAGAFINAIGMVKDCRLPIPTKGTGMSKA